jgi:predicted MPP superfamily phosphohydrolase
VPVPLAFVIFLLLWGGLHVYIAERLLSITWVAQHLPPPVLVPLLVFLGASYIVSRVMEHFELGRASHLLEYIGATWVGLFFLIFASLFASDVVTLFGFILRDHVITIRVTALLMGAAMALIAFVQAWRIPIVTEYEVAMPGLPQAADGKVLAVGSDLHLGSMLGHRWAVARAAQFAALQPDILLLAGDIFEGEKETHAGWLPVLRQFRAPLGVFAVTGNHEFYAGPEAILDTFRSAGFRVLRDEHCEILPGLRIAGVDDPAFRKRGKQDQAIAVAQALANSSGAATVFLSHTPVLAERAAELGAGLMLSGHTHEGQIWPFKYLVRIAFRLVHGRYDVNGMTAIVGRGTGTWGPRMRLWSRSEILRITLRSTGAKPAESHHPLSS